MKDQMSDTILVVVEQREGKLNRVSWETITAAQAIAAATGWGLEAAVVGATASSLASEVATKKLAKVYAVESPRLEPYTPDAFAAALKQLLSAKQPKLVLMPHTYQVRDFVPKLATAMGRTVISDCIGFKYEDGKLVFTRQMFQGKLAADVSFASDAPWFATFQNGAFRGDKAEASTSPAPVETVSVEIADGVIRTKPQEVFKEAKQAVDLTQAEIIVSVGRGIKEQKISRSPNNSPTHSAETSRHRVPSAIRDGFPWTARSAPQDKRLPRNFIWPSASAARFNTSWA